MTRSSRSSSPMAGSSSISCFTPPRRRRRQRQFLRPVDRWPGWRSGPLGGALTAVGINDRFMKDVAQTLQAGSAALFLMVRKMTTDKVLADLQGVGGTVLRSSFDHTKEEALRIALAAHAASQPATP